MSFQDAVGIRLQSLSASAYGSTSYQAFLDAPRGAGAIVAYGRCAAVTGTGNLKLDFDHAVESFASGNFWNIADQTLTSSSAVATTFVNSSLTSLLPYVRVTATVEAAGAGETKFEQIIAKLIAERK